MLLSVRKPQAKKANSIESEDPDMSDSSIEDEKKQEVEVKDESDVVEGADKSEEDSDSEDVVPQEEDNSSDFLSDGPTESGRPITIDSYVPQFPNLPSGRAWYARKEALGEAVPSTTLPQTTLKASAPKKASTLKARTKRAPSSSDQSSSPEPTDKMSDQSPGEYLAPILSFFLSPSPQLPRKQKQPDILTRISRSEPMSSTPKPDPGVTRTRLRSQTAAKPEEDDFFRIQPNLVPNEVLYHSMMEDIENTMRGAKPQSKNPNANAEPKSFNTTPFTPYIQPGYARPENKLLFRNAKTGVYEEVAMPDTVCCSSLLLRGCFITNKQRVNN